MRIILLSLISLFLGCGQQTKVYDYPIEIAKNNLEAEYDVSKMILYESKVYKNNFGCINGDSNEKVSFVECDLVFDEIVQLSQKRDTIELYFRTNFKGTPVFGMMNIPTPSSVIFYNGNPSRVRKGEAGHTKLSFNINDKSTEIFKREIKLHKNTLNPWLKREAKKRGYL